MKNCKNCSSSICPFGKELFDLKESGYCPDMNVKQWIYDDITEIKELEQQICIIKQRITRYKKIKELLDAKGLSTRNL